MPLVVVGVVGLFAWEWLGIPVGVALIVFAAGMLVFLRVGVMTVAPVVIGVPVGGRWRAVHSPADHVPSHGLLAYGQSHAVDLVHEPWGTGRTRYGGWGLVGRPPSDFPGFGQPIVCPVDGTVTAAVDGQRDHRGRTSWPLILWMLLESVPREVGGPRWILGNHIVVRREGCEHVLLAHLRRGSLRVQVGDVVRAGQPLAECGNSGNSSEPHVHVQVMDHPRPWFAAGLPMTFTTRPAQAGEAADDAGSVPTCREPVDWPVVGA
jgi:hypothetical protein